ncbi:MULTISPECIES: hypothetical protein [unclassified Micromonospora]|uniref:hypothetical protein n=1 Tax=unclassified Micromonospora TaxID=2617518 RepID=UPI003A8BB432
MSDTEPPVCPGDLVALRQCDHVDGDRPVRLRVEEIWPSPEWLSWVTLYGREISDDPQRHGNITSVRAYRDALRRPGIVTRTTANNQGCPVRPVESSPGAGNPIVAPASGDPAGTQLGPC